MDLNLALSYQEQNDNKAIVLTDTTTNWDSSTTDIAVGDTMEAGVFYEIVAGGDGAGYIDFVAYGAPDNDTGTRFVTVASETLDTNDILTPVTPTIAEIDGATLDTVVVDVSESENSKEQVDLYAEFGPFVTQADLVYTITATLLGDTEDSVLTDGLYELTYSITYSGNGITTKTDTLVVTILVYGVVKVLVYEKLREISTLYMCTQGCPSPEISEADLAGAYLSSIESSAYTAKTEELLDMLVTLTSIVTNGSKITW